MPDVLILARRSDRAAAGLAAHLRACGRRVRRLAPASLWGGMRPELTVGRDGRLESSLDAVAVFNRFVTPLDCELPDWRPADRRYAARETAAAALAFLCKHPAVVNRPLPHAPSGMGLRWPEQSALAAACGLSAPDWLLTSEAAEARAFLDENDGRAVYRANSEDVFDFSLATPQRLPLARARLLAPVLLLAAPTGRPLVSTWVRGRLWHADALDGAPRPAPAAEAALARTLAAAGADFLQAVGVAGGHGYRFFGMTGFPQLRFYRAFADEVHASLARLLERP